MPETLQAKPETKEGEEKVSDQELADLLKERSQEKYIALGPGGDVKIIDLEKLQKLNKDLADRDVWQ